MCNAQYIPHTQFAMYEMYLGDLCVRCACYKCALVYLYLMFSDKNTCGSIVHTARAQPGGQLPP